MFENFERQTIQTSGASINLLTSGQGYPLLLLHGYPQTHVMWHKLAPHLAEHFSLVIPDLRGYGDSSKPESGSDHSTYSKRTMALDQVEVMAQLGYDEFYVAGHDRGARIGHRMAVDHPDKVKRLAVLDIAPTYKMYTTADMEFATVYYHWFFLIQAHNIPEQLIGADPVYFLRSELEARSADPTIFTPAAMAEYIRCFSQPASLHAICEDYRASATIDLQHDEADRLTHKVKCPLLALWGSKGFLARKYDVLATWRERAEDVSGQALPGGHFLAEELPDQTLEALLAFFKSQAE